MSTPLFDSRFMSVMATTYFAHTCDILKVVPGAIDGVGQYSAATWAVDQADVPCVMYYIKDVTRFVKSTGTIVDELLRVVFPSTVTLAEEGYRIQTIDPGFTGTYDVIKPHRDDMGNWIAELEKVYEP